MTGRITLLSFSFSLKNIIDLTTLLNRRSLYQGMQVTPHPLTTLEGSVAL